MTPPASGPNPDLSIVVPCFNEEGNLRPLVQGIIEAVEPLKLKFEVLLVDDASRDGTWSTIRELAQKDSRISGLRLKINRGQSAAMFAGLRAGRGQILATLDADLQNDPRDLPALLAALPQYDCACGNRVAARAAGDSFVRVASSRIANWARNRLSGDTITDSGCCFRVLKRECVANLKFFKGMHRFMPTLIKLEGFNVVEIPIRQNARYSGESKYGVWNRLFASFYDLLAVRWMKKRMFRFEIAERIN